MSTISKSLLGFLFNGATVTLAAAPWKNNVRALYGFNAAGTGYQVFKPGNRFNSLTGLNQDGSYILDALTPGFELPGATLAVAPVGPSAPATTWPTPQTGVMAGSLRVTNVSAHATDLGKQLFFTAQSLDSLDLDLLLVSEALDASLTLYCFTIPAGGSQYTLPLAASVAVGDTHTFTLVNRNGNAVSSSFTLLAG